MNIEEAIKEVENYLDYEGSISITAIAMLYTAYEKQSKEIEEYKDIVETLRKENVSLYIERRQKENKIKAKIEFIKSLKEKFYYEENVISILQSLLDKE